MSRHLRFIPDGGALVEVTCRTALPGGIGTLDEWFETWTWAQLGLHAKPIGLLDVAGYYDHLLRFLDHVVPAQRGPPRPSGDQPPEPSSSSRTR